MIITYELQDNLYVNVTNKCTNSCDFCVRNLANAFEDDLWLPRDPTASEIISDIFSRDLNKYKEVVFCGFGEPLENINEVIEVSKAIKENIDIKIRINTNGLANKIHNMDVTPRFRNLIDSISISLNAKNAEEYDDICHSIYGKDAFNELLDFAKKCKANVEEVQLSVVDCIPRGDIDECKKIAESIGVKFKVRREVK